MGSAKCCGSAFGQREPEGVALTSGTPSGKGRAISPKEERAVVVCHSPIHLKDPYSQGA